MEQRVSPRTKAAFLAAVMLTAWGGGVQSAIAEIFYPSYNYRVQGPPTYCTVITGIPVPQSKINEFVDISKNAVEIWSHDLQSYEKDIKSIWQMSHRSVGHAQAECDIMVLYKPYSDKSTQSASHDVIFGLFSPNGIITVYYLQPYRCGEENLCYYEGKYRSKKSMSNTMAHEIGHSIGLGHYVSDNPDKNEKWWSGKELSPSVMIPSQPPGSSGPVIKEVDVLRVRELYGEKGFYAYSDGDIPIVRPFITIDVSSDRIVLDKSDSNTLTISGQIAKNTLLEGHPIIVTILKPDQTVEVLKASHTRSGYFEILTSYDFDAPLGLYTVSVSYLGVVDTEMDVHFEITKNVNDIKHSFMAADPVDVIDEQTAAVKSLKMQTENIKKAISAVSKSKIGESDYNLIHGIFGTLELQIESAQIQLDVAKQRYADDDYNAMFAALQNLEESTTFISSALERIDGKLAKFSSAVPSISLDGAKSAAVRFSAGLDDGTGLASAVYGAVGSENGAEFLPDWVESAAKWWTAGRISDTEFGNMLEYLGRNGIL